MKKFLTLLYEMRNKINAADLEFRYNFDKSDMKCNPFVSNPLKTYIWVEKIKKEML